MTFRDLIGQHLALIASALLVLLAAFKIFWFSGPSISTALAIAGTVNYVSVMFSTLVISLPLIPVVLIFVFPGTGEWLSAGMARWASSTERWRAALWIIPWSFLMPWAMTLATGGAIAMAIVYEWADRRRALLRRKISIGWIRAILKFLWGLLPVTAISLSIAPLALSPWLPLEEISLRESNSIMTGYIVGESGGRILFLDREKIPHWFELGDIGSREVCAEEYNFLTNPIFASKTEGKAC